MRQGWSENAERKLLLSMLDPNVKPKWDVVARRMGEGLTGEACRYVHVFTLASDISARALIVPGQG